jgi:hypothetical protein
VTKIVLLDAQLSIANNSLTNWTAKLELSDEFEAKRTRTFGSEVAGGSLGGL